MNLRKEHKHTLLNIAEWSVLDFLENGRREFPADKFTIDEVLESNLGVFVSVYVDGQLRGCIGTFSESDPIYKNVHRMTIQAAFEDRRFKPVSIKEVTKMTIEISVLSKRVRVKGPEDIIIGKHGVYMIYGIRRATLLPQVAVKNKWSAIDLLECCAKNKLGMHKDSWKDAELFVYEALVFS